MKKNRIITLFTLLLVIIAGFLYLSRGSGTFRDKEKDFAVKDTATVTRVFLADKNNRSILLERTGIDEWKLNNRFRARKSGVDILLETMKNLQPKYPVPKKAHDNIVSQLAVQSIKVEVYQMVYRINLFDRIKLFQHEKLTKTYYVGAATADNMGTFMLMEGADVPFIVHLLGFRGYVAPRYSTIEKDWRDHRVFRTKLYDIAEVTMEMPGKPESSYKVINEDDQIQLVELNTNRSIPYDTLRLLNFLTAFSDIRFEALLDQVDPERQDSITNSMPQHVLSLTDMDGESRTIKTFYKPNDDRVFDPEGNFYTYDVDRLYALVNEDRDFVLIQYYVFDKVLRPLEYFRVD